MRTVKFLDLFSGIGGFRLGMEHAGHECVAFCEIDKFARTSYKAIHDTTNEVEMHDITTVSDDFIRGLGDIDIICGGFPCQAFSIAGKRKGFEDTRGTLFFEIARFASILRPRYLFLENVKGLLNHEGGATFETILRALDELGYDAEWQVLNSKNFGVPQNRERVFIIGHLRGERTRKVFPFQRSDKSFNQNVIKEIAKVNEKRHSSLMNSILDPEGISPTLDTMSGGGREPKIVIRVTGNINPSGNGMNGQVYDSEGLSPTITTNKGEGLKVIVREATKKGYAEAYPGDSVNISHPNSKTRRGRVGKQVANTLLTGEEQAVVTNEYRIRKLTPRECWRLQGFPDWAFDRAAEVNSDSQLYKQAGNSVTVNVIKAIAERLD